MKEFTTTISGTLLKAKCDENLSLQAEWLLQTIKEIGERKNGLEDGETIRLSGTILTVRKNGEGLVLYEPDYAGNPFKNTIDSVNNSLIILAQQNDVLNKLGIVGTPVLFSEKVVFAKNCLQSKKIYLERSANVSSGDSGWYIGNAENKSEATELEALYVYQLQKIRPEIMSVLSLPSGYLTVFDGNKIEAILDENNRNLWN